MALSCYSLSSKIEEMSNELASVNGRIRDIKPDGLSLPSVDHICKWNHLKRAGWREGGRLWNKNTLFQWVFRPN